MRWIVSVAVFALVAAVSLVVPVVLARRRRAAYAVSADALFRGSELLLRWDDLKEVAFVTTDEGPFAEDLFLVLVPVDGRDVIFRCLEIPAPVIERLWSLPAFDREAFGTAMRSTHRAKHVVWKRAA